MPARLSRLLRNATGLLLVLTLSSCALFQGRDPVTINVIGIDPLPGQDLEVRMAVKLRVQNPNETPIDYNGLALNLEVNGQPLAAGVSNQHGRIERFSEEVLVVPVSITAFSVMRQALGLSRMGSLDGMPYEVYGKLAGGAFGSVRFRDRGTFELPR